MRVWDITPVELCSKHLVAEHAEIHGVFGVIRKNTVGYSAHPEVKRWRGKLGALTRRHDVVSAEMASRGYRHTSPIEAEPGSGSSFQDVLINTLDEQRALLRAKTCNCFNAPPG